MVLDTAHLALLRQQVFEMAAPARRILTLAVAARGRPVDDRLDTPAQPGSRLRLCRPKGSGFVIRSAANLLLQHLHHERDIDGLHGEHAKDRIDVCGERARPLFGMLRVFPPGIVRLDVGFTALAKGPCLCVIELHLKPLGSTNLDRVDAVETQAAASRRTLASFGEPDSVGRAKPHLPELPRLLKPEYPGFRPRSAHLQKEPATIAVIATPPRLIDSQRCQFSDRSRHSPSPD